MKKTVITYGLLSGGISAALMLITSLTIGFDHGGFGYLIGYTAMILAFLFIYFGMASYRDNMGGGTIKYGKALAIGILIAIISSICYVIMWAFVYHFMFPDFMDKYSTDVINKLRAKGAPEAEIIKQIAGLQQMKEMYKNPVLFFLFTFIEPFPVGVAISLISAFIVRMKKKRVTV
jgi:hypothetical protein